jgi:hypothetical protein
MRNEAGLVLRSADKKASRISVSVAIRQQFARENACPGSQINGSWTHVSVTEELRFNLDSGLVAETAGYG